MITLRDRPLVYLVFVLLITAGCVAPTQYAPPTPTALSETVVPFEALSSLINRDKSEGLDREIYLIRSEQDISAAFPDMDPVFSNSLMQNVQELDNDQALIVMGSNSQGAPEFRASNLFLKGNELVVYGEHCLSQLLTAETGWRYAVVRITLPAESLQDLLPVLVPYETYCQ